MDLMGYILGGLFFLLISTLTWDRQIYVCIYIYIPVYHGSVMVIGETAKICHEKTKQTSGEMIKYTPPKMNDF